MTTKDSKTNAAIVEHAELDILDSLGLTDDTPHVRLKHLFLDQSPETAEASISQLKTVLSGRLDEGRGEALVDVGQEDNGDSMGFEKTDWDVAYERIALCAKALKAECRLLITRNVGGPSDVEVTGKDKSCTGKVMIRRIPQSVDDVIETRIAVVGNGMRGATLCDWDLG